MYQNAITQTMILCDYVHVKYSLSLAGALCIVNKIL